MNKRYQPFVAPQDHEEVFPTARIRAHYLDAARAMLNKLADKAETYGQQITWKEEKYTRDVCRERWDGVLIKVTENWVKLYVDGVAPRYGEFKFVAMLERLKGGVLIKSIPDVEVGDYGRDWDGYCDHCGSKRDRVHGYVIEDPNGRKIVGKSCVRDYLGMDDPARLLSVFREAVNLSNMGDDEEGFGGGHWTTDIWGVIAAARCAVGMFGYARKDAGADSTLSRVNSLTSRDKKTEPEKKLMEEFYARPEHYYVEAQNVIAWARALDSSNDYLNNLKVVLTSDYVRKEHMGIAVSAVSAYDNEQARLRRIEEAKKAIVPSTGYVGEIKKRMQCPVTVDRIIAVKNMWSDYRIILFRTHDGATLKWSTSNDTDTRLGDRPLNAGDCVEMAFTPQKHEPYNGDPQTTVNRCKIIAAC